LIFAELPLADALGAMLAHGITLGGRRHPKGATVDAELVAAAAAQRVTHLWVARLEAGDRPEAEAAVELASELAGDGVEARAPAHGRVNLHARHGGLLLLDPQAITAANLATEALGLSTLPPLSPVEPGAMVATVKIIPYAVSADQLAAAAAALRPLKVAPWRSGLSALLIQSRLSETADKLLAKTREVTETRLARLGVPLHEAPSVLHSVDAIAAALRAAQADLILLAGATATSDPRDVIPAAIRAAGGDVLRVGMPVDPGNLLVLGRLGSALLIGLPGCARSPKRNGLDLVLEHWAAGLGLDAARIAAMGVGGLLEDSGTPVPWGWNAGWSG
jgi:molybdenum cofactor cytidylyltransferase